MENTNQFPRPPTQENIKLGFKFYGENRTENNENKKYIFNLSI